MAMSCFAIPLDGLPTRRMRFSCASVASGISEKSICESGIGFALPSARLPRANDPDRFFLMLRPPDRIHHEDNSPRHGLANALAPMLPGRVLRIIPVQPLGIVKNGGGFFEGNAVLLKIRNGFAVVPREHATVYTVIRGFVAIRLSSGGASYHRLLHTEAAHFDLARFTS